MPHGEVPYARFEITWLWHPKRQKYTATQREIYTSMWLLACHERRANLCASCYPPAYLAKVCCMDTRTLLQGLRKLTEPDGLLVRESDGSLTVTGVEVKNARLDWKTGCPHAPKVNVEDFSGNEIAPPPYHTIPVPIPKEKEKEKSAPPPSHLSDYTQRQKEIAEVICTKMRRNLLAMNSDDQIALLEWVKEGEGNYPAGDVTEFVSERYKKKPVRNPYSLAQGIAEGWALPKGVEPVGQVAKADEAIKSRYKQEQERVAGIAGACEQTTFHECLNGGECAVRDGVQVGSYTVRCPKQRQLREAQ